MTGSAHKALRIEKAFDVSMGTLMRMQTSCDIAQERKRKGEIEVTRFTGDRLPTLAWVNYQYQSAGVNALNRRN